MKFLIALFLIIAPVQDKPDCREIERLTGGTEIPWLGYPRGWDLPDDIRMTRRLDFAPGHGGVWIFEADSRPGTRWLWWFGDYEVDGDPPGAHHFCAVVIDA